MGCPCSKGIALQLLCTHKWGGGGHHISGKMGILAFLSVKHGNVGEDSSLNTEDQGFNC